MWSGPILVSNPGSILASAEVLGPKGNPQARNLFEVIVHLQRVEGLHFELSLNA